MTLFQHVNERFYPHEEIDADAVLSLDEDALLITDEVVTLLFFTTLCITVILLLNRSILHSLSGENFQIGLLVIRQEVIIGMRLGNNGCIHQLKNITFQWC